MQRKSRFSGVWITLASVSAICVGAAMVTAAHSRQAERPALMDTVSPETKHAIESANGLSMAFRAISEHMLPSVVAIENRPAVAATQQRMMRPSGAPSTGENPFRGTPFEDMFREFEFPNRPGEPGMPKGFSPKMPSPARGIGSGVIIDADGIILTNNHVVAGGGEVTVRVQDGREFIASSVWTDPKTDIAVVKIDGATDLVPAKLGDSDAMEIGDWVVALGQPFGLESTVTAGIISAKHRGIGITARENFLQTDAAINPGNSGGPLVNLAGEVIGINTAISSRGGGNDGIGFSVPSNLARWVSDQLVSHGTVKRAYLGVGIQPVTQDLAKQLGVKPRAGVLVTEIHDGTPAADMGLQSGDVIVSFGGTSTQTPQALQLAVERATVGQKVDVQILRDSKPMTMTYVGTEVPEEFLAKADGEPTLNESRLSDWGLEVDKLSAEVAKSLNLKSDGGVVITRVEEGSPAAEAGLEPGMVIAQVDRKPMESVDDFVAAMKSAEESNSGTLLLIRTEQGSRFVVLKR
ncbi:Do family serine endopeptidase [Stieleria varia]|uniref:Putative periplasmic serine endoprotease DegP-like n=1 Tax=Stieleria varia TaxID=2528005 RepID=A0A5C6AN66_9BACT|nr:Do family serine endopeptidase [Stieleria varia]TWU00958.1 putative periplasmic serine endoprotease DegP-like precursor [Stieleria varia]